MCSRGARSCQPVRRAVVDSSLLRNSKKRSLAPAASASLVSNPGTVVLKSQQHRICRGSSKKEPENAFVNDRLTRDQACSETGATTACFPTAYQPRHRPRGAISSSDCFSDCPSSSLTVLPSLKHILLTNCYSSRHTFLSLNTTDKDRCAATRCLERPSGPGDGAMGPAPLASTRQELPVRM